MGKNETFYVALYDDDNKAYKIIGPMHDDTGITKRTCEMQNEGRRVRCSTVGTSESSLQEAARSMEALGYTRDNSLYW